MLTCPCDVNPLTPYFYVVYKLGFTGVHIQVASVFAAESKTWIMGTR